MVSARVDALTRDLSRVEETVVGIDGKLDRLADSMSTLARLEERHQGVVAQLLDGNKRMDGLSVRLGAIESVLPGLVETRRWVVAGVVGVFCLVGIALIRLVLTSG